MTDGTRESGRLTSAQAAARLGVKPETLYAYVSRGLIGRRRDEHGASTFDPLDVEALAASRSRSAPPTHTRGGRPLMTLDSPLTLIENDQLYYRGVPAAALAGTLSFEQAADFFWGGETASLASTPSQVASAAPPPTSFASDAHLVARSRTAADQLGPGAKLIDHLHLSVLLAASDDPNRDDLHPQAVTTAARLMIATMVDALPEAAPPATRPPATAAPTPAVAAPTPATAAPTPATAAPDASIAARLWRKLSCEQPTPGDLALLDTALVLCIDHDLAVATLAARAAASARAHPYAAVAAALSAFDSTLHGAASVGAARLLREALSTGLPERVLRSSLASGQGLPGFGHLIYRQRDPRASAILGLMRGDHRYGHALRVADRLAAIVNDRTPRVLNVDFALAVLTVGSGMRDDAGQVIFAVARTAGWVGHMLDEYQQHPLRLRPESRYSGRRP